MVDTKFTSKILLNDGLGNLNPIQTGIWTSRWYDIDMMRRLSITVGQLGSTGGPQTVASGGFTGIMLVQGTDERGVCCGATGTQSMGCASQPGTNGFTGALYPNVIPSGTLSINGNQQSQLFSLTDVGCKWIRLQFNGPNSLGSAVSTGTLGGSGTMEVFFTAKNT